MFGVLTYKILFLKIFPLLYLPLFYRPTTERRPREEREKRDTTISPFFKKNRPKITLFLHISKKKCNFAGRIVNCVENHVRGIIE